MNKYFKTILSLLAVFILIFALTAPAFADEINDSQVISTEETAEAENGNNESTTNIKAIVAAALVGLVATAGAIAMAIAISTGSKGISRQPEAAGNIRTNVMLGLVFIETAIIYALIVAILVIFVL